MGTTKSRSTFRLEYRVSTNIRATAPAVWGLLTNVGDYPRWNSTVTSSEGMIKDGETIRLKVAVAPKRLFKLGVSEVVPNRSMVWSDGFAPMFRGVRTFTLTPKDDATVDFEMVEVFRGLMLPMIAGSLPDFEPVFARYAEDLKKEAEQRFKLRPERRQQPPFPAAGAAGGTFIASQAKSNRSNSASLFASRPVSAGRS